MTEAWLETLSADDCHQLLRENAVGRIAFVIDNVPTILPVNYRLVESRGATPGTWIAVRTRPGNVIDQASASVAFEIDGIDASRRQGWSVLVRGEIDHIDAGPGRDRFDSEPWLAAERDAWLVVTPFEITGRRLHAGETDWPFTPGAYL